MCRNNINNEINRRKELEDQVKFIIKEEFSELIENIRNDFNTNYIRKQYNLFLSTFDNRVVATMVFVSSFESKSGLAIEKIARNLAKLRYGDDNVPTIVNPNGIEHNIDPATVKGQIIVTNIDIKNATLKGKITNFRARRVANGSGNNRTESTVTQTSIRRLLRSGRNFQTENLRTKPVDLAFYDGENWNVIELKMGGNLDSSNGPSNIEKLLLIYTGINCDNAKIYFATAYNKDGEGNSWTGTAKKHMRYPEMFLIGRYFWEKILPEEISFERFTELYNTALEEINLNTAMKDLIDGTVN